MGTRSSLVRGAIAGVAGVSVMTLAEKIEQRMTHRPNSYVPAKTLAVLLGRPATDYDHHQVFNWTMHWGQGVLLGTVRGLMAEHGVRGPVGSFLFTHIRFANDQLVENVTGIGSPPWTWPLDEQLIDLVHKTIYGFVTGYVSDKLIAGPAGIPRQMIPWAERGT